MHTAQGGVGCTLHSTKKVEGSTSTQGLERKQDAEAKLGATE